MIRSILIVLSEPPDDAAARNCAFWLAKKEGSHIHGLAVVDLSTFEVPVLGGPDSFMPTVMTPPLRENQILINDLIAASKERVDLFASQCAARGISAFTEVQSGIPGEVVSQAAIAHDIVILSRTGYGRIANMRETVDSWIAPVVRDSVRPVWVAGAEFKEGGEKCNLLIAYDGSAHAARALLPAAELAARPGVDCMLVTVAQTAESGKDVLAPAEAFLQHHGIVPRTQVLMGSKPSEVICELAASGGTDVLVMGAYGHSPIREVLFGSTTEKILTHCAANVILQS
jgi:nucleotide-binding universal stress UspA family protein